MSQKTQSKVITHVYQLRPDWRISLKLPANLTQEEARRLATAITTYPNHESLTLSRQGHTGGSEVPNASDGVSPGTKSRGIPINPKGIQVGRSSS